MTNAPLLERMVDLTAIRDADLLDLSLLRTVREVCAAEELSLLRIAPDSNSIAGHGLVHLSMLVVRP